MRSYSKIKYPSYLKLTPELKLNMDRIKNLTPEQIETIRLARNKLYSKRQKWRYAHDPAYRNEHISKNQRNFLKNFGVQRQPKQPFNKSVQGYLDQLENERKERYREQAELYRNAKKQAINNYLDNSREIIKDSVKIIKDRKRRIVKMGLYSLYASGAFLGLSAGAVSLQRHDHFNIFFPISLFLVILAYIFINFSGDL